MNFTDECEANAKRAERSGYTLTAWRLGMFARTTHPRIALLEFTRNSGDDSEETIEEFVLPEDLSTLNDDELAALREQATTAFDAIRDGDLDAEALANLEALKDGINAIKDEQASRETAAAAARTRADELAAEVHGEPEAEVVDGEAEVTDGAEAAEAATESEVAEAAETPGEPAPAAAAAAAAEDTSLTAAAVARASRTPIRVPLGAVRAHAAAPEVDEATDRVVITAAADIPNVATGSRMDRTGVARAMHSRARHLGEGHSALIASIAYPDLGPELTITEADSVDTMTEKLNASREVDSLMAAGGWCTPSQYLYDLFSIEGTDGLVDLPTINMTRGGVQFVQDGGPSIADVWAAPWLWTEANDISAAGNPHLDPDNDVTKPCVRIPCPTWTEERLDAYGLCITHGNLADRAYPELTRRFLDLVMASHAHFINTSLLTAMEAAAHGVTIAATFGAASALMSAIDLQASDYRDKYRMGDNAVLEAVFPRWTRGVVRADVARRNAQPFGAVTNAQIAAEFANLQIRPQFVYDWQPLQTGAGGADGYRELWPDSVKFLLYAAGTYVRGNGGSIDLGVTRDSVLNPVNDHTVAFTEDFLLLAKMGHEARVVTVPVEPNGATGGQVTVAAIGA